ncbi:MAG: TetR/AcrR family transcriptional regulator [Mycobacterium sp.]|nr:MAG: TetR/AcrR family transcriptional regulator [Mycobacterium sp.]
MLRPMAVPKISPNRREKRREIIEVAKSALLAHGLDRFTARALTESGSFSRSAIHYYFDSVEEIVDAAMTSELEAFLEMLNAVAAEHTAPLDRFWAVTQRYLAHFSSQPALTLLWFDYSIAAVQAGRPHPAIEIESRLQEIFVGLLRDCGVPDWQSRSEALLAFMLGTTLRGVLHPGAPAGDLRRQLAAVSGLEWRDDGP